MARLLSKYLSKSQISITEVVASILILFVFLSTLSLREVRSRWENAILSITGRDVSFVTKAIENTSKLLTQKNYKEIVSKLVAPVVAEIDLENCIKDEILIACNCTNETVGLLENNIGKLILNGREIKIHFLMSLLSPINPASDALLIWGYKNLEPYEKELKNYLKSGKGIILVGDFGDAPDETSKQIFGLEKATYSYSSLSDFYFMDSNPNYPNYQLFKFFFHIPLPIFTFKEKEVSFEGITKTVECGNISIRDSFYEFCIWNESGILVDQDGDSLLDEFVEERENFWLDQERHFNFTLSYLTEKEIYVSFDYGYNFSDILKGKSNVTLPEQSRDRITLASSFNNQLIPACVVNSTLGRNVWITNLTKTYFSDDKRLLLLSALVYSSSKKKIGKIRRGVSIPILIVSNKDMLETCVINLKLYYPY